LDIVGEDLGVGELLDIGGKVLSSGVDHIGTHGIAAVHEKVED